MRKRTPAQRQELGWGLKNRYGITLADYDRMMAEADYRCQICRIDYEGAVSKHKNGLCVDHDHTTGEVRGILCQHCNIAIGHLSDSSQLARAAANYLTAGELKWTNNKQQT